MMLKTRIAPTPSGYLHLGNAFSFLLTWLLARKHNGHLRLRIDDLDGPRIQKAYLEDIFHVLNWLRIDYDAGPENVRDFVENHSQASRMSHYQEVLEKLKQGGWLFPCQCSRRDIRRSSKTGKYPGTCHGKALSFTDELAWRVQLPDNCKIAIKNDSQNATLIDLSEEMGDFVVRRKDGLPAYQVASLADDVFHEINYIVRGADLLPSTAAQLFLSSKLEFTSFNKAIFLHHPLLKSDSGEKLAKSTKAPPLAALKEKYQNPAVVYKHVAHLLGLPFAHDMLTISDLLEAFSVEKLNFEKSGQTS